MVSTVGKPVFLQNLLCYFLVSCKQYREVEPHQVFILKLFFSFFIMIETCTKAWCPLKSLFDQVHLSK